MKCETRHHNSGLLESSFGFHLCLALLVVSLVVAWNHAIAQRGTRTLVVTVAAPETNRLPSASYQLPSPIAAAALAPATNRTVRVTLAWDASPDHRIVSNYAVRYGIAPRTYTNTANASTNLSITISNLVPATRYYFAAFATSRDGINSPNGAEIFWPVPFTNYIGVGIKTNGRVITQLIYTNPPGDVVLFEPFIWQTNNQVAVVRLPSGNLIVGNTNQP